jgi:hypothetical protein
VPDRRGAALLDDESTLGDEDDEDMYDALEELEHALKDTPPSPWGSPPPSPWGSPPPSPQP